MLPKFCIDSIHFLPYNTIQKRGYYGDLKLKEDLQMTAKNSNYTLYLDESQTHKYNPTSHACEQYHFCMAGIIIANDDYINLENSVNKLKRNMWPGLPNPENIILHQMLILNAEKGRLDTTEHPEYAKFNKNDERKKFYYQLKKSLRKII